MWDSFCLTVLVEILVIFLPGFASLRAIRFPTLSSVIYAPVLSIPVYAVLGILYDKLHIFSNWLTLFLPFLIVSAIALAISLGLGRKKAYSIASEHSGVKKQKNQWVVLGMYILVGCAVAVFYFVLPLNSAESFNQGPDNAPHLSLIQTFIESGNYSSLNASYYHSIDNSYQDPTGSNGKGGFYPAAWHCVTALSASITNVPATVASNASLFVFLACIFPLGVYSLMRVLFENKTLMIAFGAIVALAFGAFPWGLLSFGPLYPNFSAFAIVPFLMSLFIAAFHSSVRPIKRASILVVFVIGLIGAALLQTNAVFTVAVMLLFFVCGAILQLKNSVKTGLLLYRWVRWILVILFLGLFLGLWQVAYSLPIMQGIVSYPWEPFSSVRQEVVNILFTSYRDSAASPLLGISIILGIGYLLIVKKHRWLIGTYLLMAGMCIVAASQSGDFRSLVIGFWYTDSYRIAAMAALAAIPLAACGLYAMFCLISRLWDKCSAFLSRATTTRRAKFLAVCLCACAILYYPSFTIYGVGGVKTPLGEFESVWFDLNHNLGNCVLDEKEQDFLDQVKLIVGNSLVINKPDDGSVFGYGADGIDMLYKRTGIEAYNTDSNESKLVRNKLNEYATNQDVQDAVEKMNAKYLLLLDSDPDDASQQRYWFDHYYEDLWRGMDAVNEDTPGFKLVLSKDDMRLYEIETL